MNGQFISIATSFINWETSDEFLGPDRSSPRQLNSGYGILGQSNASALGLVDTFMQSGNFFQIRKIGLSADEEGKNLICILR